MPQRKPLLPLLVLIVFSYVPMAGIVSWVILAGVLIDILSPSRGFVNRMLSAALSLGSVLNAGFEQILNLYNPLVYETGDIIDTLVYRTGIIEAQYGPATAVGLFQSVVALILISASYYLAYRFANYQIF